MYLIVGIDPGKTCGIVCLDLDGKLRFKDHKMFGGMDWVLSMINSVGTPVITASDKPQASEFVKKINTVFNSRLFCPERDYRIIDKRTVAKGTGIRDPHERDAYTAAISAYNAYANTFKQVEHPAHQNSYANIEEIKAKVVGKYSIKEALENRKANRK